jgi:tRNA(Glu) U13 pseudouridine synthase TruD
VAGVDLPVYRRLPSETQTQLAGRSIVMPHHRAAYPDPDLAPVVEAVLSAEGVTLHDLKARILQRAYLSRHVRPLLLQPARLYVGEPKPDEFFRGRQELSVAFDLPRGSYASLVLSCAALWASNQ